MFLLVAVGGVAVTVWRVSLARRMARQSGMDPDQATAVTLLSEDGLSDTYLASSLRKGMSTQPAPTPPARDAGERLRELQSLRDQGLLTAEEYETRRSAIVDSI